MHRYINLSKYWLVRKNYLRLFITRILLLIFLKKISLEYYYLYGLCQVIIIRFLFIIFIYVKKS
jgi:hypothetical protein